jgi:fructose-bisphosphate aldolase class I
MLASASTFTGVKVVAKATAKTTVAKRAACVTRAGQYDDELLETATNMTKPGKGILAMDESNATCGSRLEGVGVENTEENRRRYRELLITTPNLGEYIGGAILFEETLYQSCKDGTPFVDVLKSQGVYPGIKVDKGLKPLANSNGESWCQGLDGLAERAAEYYKQGARFCKWRSVVSIPAGPSKIAVTDCAYGLARYAAICQNAGLVPIVEPEILLDGDHDIDRNFEVASMVWAETFKYLADNNVKFDRMLLKPSMVAPGADCPKKSNPQEVAEYTLRMLNSRVPPQTAGIMFLSGGLSELDSTLYLNAMNQTPNPWHVSFSYARALQNSVISHWAGNDDRVAEAQAILKTRTVENGMAQLGKFDVTKSNTAGADLFQKGYVY